MTIYHPFGPSYACNDCRTRTHITRLFSRLMHNVEMASQKPMSPFGGSSNQSALHTPPPVVSIAKHACTPFARPCYYEIVWSARGLSVLTASRCTMLRPGSSAARINAMAALHHTQTALPMHRMTSSSFITVASSNTRVPLRSPRLGYHDVK